MRAKTKTKVRNSGGGRTPTPKTVAAAGQPAEARIAGFVQRYSPPIQKQLLGARRRLRKLFPRGYELVFDNYNALVFGFSATELSSGSFVSVAGYPKWVTLFFLHGADLSDARGLLVGGGKQIRSLRLKEAEDLDDAYVRRLIVQSMARYAAALAEAPRLTTTIKTVVTKQRPRRPGPRSV